jgi:hypothetical protein
MGTLALLVLIMLAASSRGSTSTPATQPAARAAQAHHRAHVLHEKAKRTNHPLDHAAAADAAATAAQASHAAAKTTNAATSAPRPWPQVMPKGLPPWPSGWQPDSPPPADVVARAWQLLPTLWGRGAGSTKTEQTGGRWITYMAARTAGNTKGVVAYRIKGGSARPTLSQGNSDA